MSRIRRSKSPLRTRSELFKDSFCFARYARQPKIQRRSAFTLIEVVICLTVGSVIVLLAVGLMNRALLLHRASKQRVEMSYQLDRLLPEFRRLVHRCTDAEVLDDGSTLILRNPDRSYRFHFDGRDLHWPVVAEVTREPTRNDAKASAQASNRIRLSNDSLDGVRFCRFASSSGTVALEILHTPIGDLSSATGDSQTGDSQTGDSQTGDSQTGDSDSTAVLERQAVAMLSTWLGPRQPEAEKEDESAGEDDSQ